MLIPVTNLSIFWGLKRASEVRGGTCRDFVEWPERLPRAVSDQTARRELVVLSAALNLYHKEYGLDALPVVTLPKLKPTRRKALSHAEAAALLAGALGFFRDADGGVKRRPRSTRAQRKRTARFILIGLYSGTRHSAIIDASWVRRGDGPWIDAERGILYRRGEDEIETKKRRPDARIPARLLAHLRRWRRMDMDRDEPVPWVIAKGADRIAGRIRRGWEGARADAGLDMDVVPHSLRHTTGTWLAQGGAAIRQAADFMGMTERQFEQTYYHAHPDFQADIGDAFSRAARAATAVRRDHEPRTDPRRRR